MGALILWRTEVATRQNETGTFAESTAARSVPAGQAHPRRLAALIVVGLLVLTLVGAFEWPSDAGAYRFGFGTARGGLLRGVEFRPSDGLIQAAANGELTFAVDSPSLPGGYPVSGGGMVVVAHASDMTTIYSGLKRGSVSSYLKNVHAGDILGSSSTALTDRGVVFYTFDAKERRYINPLIVMPGLVDDKAPVVRSVSLSTDGTETLVDATKPIRQGKYWLLVDTYDSSPSGTASAPFELRIFIDGSERDRLVYDAIWAKNGKSLPGESSVAPDGRLRLGPYTLQRGRVALSVVVSDYNGNTREQAYSVSVQ